MQTHDEPIALRAYEELAERYAEIAPNKAENGFIEHPAIRKQIGDARGMNVLDAGCGPGFLTKHLLDQGATVTAFDISPKMLEIAARKTEGRAELHHADMAKPLAFVKNESFDMVVSSLAIDYVRDWTVPLREFHRALKSQGRFVFTVQHPLGAFLWYKPESAFGVQLCQSTWASFGGEPVVVPDYYRSFEDMINPLIQAGFQIRKLFDTKPVPELKDVSLVRYEKYIKTPTFMCIEAYKA